MKKIFVILLCVVLVLCSCQKQPDLGKEDNSLRTVDVVLDWYPNALHSFIYAAIENGYYAEEGLEVNVRFPSNANDALALVAAGKADIGLYYQQDAIQARANQAVPVKSIGAVVHYPLNVVLSLKDKNITSPADLIGKKIGYASTELSEAILSSIISYVGADSSDITAIDVGFDLMSSMTTDNVDATIGCLKNHEIPQLEEEGFEVNFFELYDYGVPIYYEGVFLANDKTIENDAEMLKAFLRASAQGFNYVKNNPALGLDILLKNQNEENFPLSPSVEQQSLEILLPMMEEEGKPFLSQEEAVWQQNIDWLFEQGIIKNKIAAGDMLAVLE